MNILVKFNIIYIVVNYILYNFAVTEISNFIIKLKL